MVHMRSGRRPLFQPDLSLILVVAVVTLLWIAGGASRADVMGQVVVRAGCWTILIVAVLTGPRPSFSHSRPVVFVLAAAIVLPLVQLIPLPPAWWLALPGREILLIPDEPVPWRPLTMTPGATRNSLASLIVPATMLFVLVQASERLHRQMTTILLAMIGLAMLIGLLQFSGVGFRNPFLNDTPGAVSSIFANRNHFALLLAIGCLIAPVWAFMDHDALRWRGPLAGGIVLLFILTILATGSRSGILLVGLALSLSMLLIGVRLRRRLKRAPSWLLPVLVGAAILVVGGLIGLSFVADRADAIKRLLALQANEDIRSRALPTVLTMIKLYLPYGSGFGGFDFVFRIHEPFNLLRLTYFNQAHNDYLGIALDGGIAGVAVLAFGILWWLVATFRVWRAQAAGNIYIGRLGSGIILLIVVASLTDYPARTPTIMAVFVVAAIWLADADAGRTLAALPQRSPNL